MWPFRRKKRFTYDEIRDIVMPVANASHVEHVFLTPSKSKREPKTWDYVDIAYYPGEGFTSDDFLRMEALHTRFPEGQCCVFACRFGPMCDNDGIPIVW